MIITQASEVVIGGGSEIRWADMATDKPSILKPEDIEAESFRIIESEIGPHSLTPEQFAVVRRVIHASADFDFKENLVFHSDAIDRGISALRAGCDIVADVEMVRSGISKANLAKLGSGRVLSFMTDEDVAAQAKAAGVTRAIMSMRKAASAAPDAIYAVGNAPTALFEIIDLIKAGKMKPALVIGVPVGFVSAVESKDALIRLNYPSIAARGRKGGSPIAVAALNALLILAGSAAPRPQVPEPPATACGR